MKVSIVTPSFNQAPFLEAALRSVLDSPGVDLEYVVMDGGSTDGSVDIIRKYADRLAHWESAPDGGQYDAITRGFQKTTGEIMGWLNSDDQYTPWALSVVCEIFSQHPDLQWLTTLRQFRLDERGLPVRTLVHPGFARGSFAHGENLPERGAFATGFLQQESTFWRRSLWEKAGAQVGKGFPLAGDFELWARFFQHAEPVGVEVPLGGFRFHGAQKTGNRQDVYLREANAALAQHGVQRWSPLLRPIRAFAHRHLLGCPVRLAAALGLVFPSQLVRHDRNSGQWKLLKTYV